MRFLLFYKSIWIASVLLFYFRLFPFRGCLRELSAFISELHQLIPQYFLLSKTKCVFLKLRKATLPGAKPFLFGGHYRRLFKTLGDKNQTTGEWLTVSSGPYTSQDWGVKDCTGISPWTSMMTQIYCLAWASHSEALPQLSRDKWPPSQYSLQTSSHFICRSGGLSSR